MTALYLQIMRDLPPAHREVAAYLINFISDLGQDQYAEVTKMTVNNLALVFAPSFLRGNESDPGSMLANQPKEQIFVARMIHFYLADDQMKNIVFSKRMLN